VLYSDRVPVGDGRSSVSVWLLSGVVLYLVGLAATFVGAGLRGRVVGLAVISGGAGIAIISALPIRSWQAAVTVAVTLVPLVLVAAALRRRVEKVADRRVTLDDDVL